MSQPDLQQIAEPRSGIAEANGAALYFEIRGSGPTLLMIPGASGDAGMYALAADTLAENFTVLTYDRRGNSRSIAPTGWTTTTVDEQAGDAAALLQVLGLAPAHVFGNSSGATIALNLVLRHPAQLVSVIAHEPPKIGILPNRDEFLAGLKARMDRAIEAGGYANAMQDFHGWLTGPEDEEPDEAQKARILGNGENWVTRELGVVDRYDAPADLIAARTTPLAIGVGTAGGTPLHAELLAMYRETLRSYAASLGAGFEEFVGAHVPYETDVPQFCDELTSAFSRLG